MSQREKTREILILAKIVLHLQAILKSFALNGKSNGAIEDIFCHILR